MVVDTSFLARCNLHIVRPGGGHIGIADFFFGIPLCATFVADLRSIMHQCVMPLATFLKLQEVAFWK